MLGCEAWWNYLEAEHGKGLCDGMGGRLKQKADQAIKKSTSITNAKSLYDWATQIESAIHFTFIERGHIYRAEISKKTKISKMK